MPIIFYIFFVIRTTFDIYDLYWCWCFWSFFQKSWLKSDLPKVRGYHWFWYVRTYAHNESSGTRVQKIYPQHPCTKLHVQLKSARVSKSARNCPRIRCITQIDKVAPGAFTELCALLTFRLCFDWKIQYTRAHTWYKNLHYSYSVSSYK